MIDPSEYFGLNKLAGSQKDKNEKSNSKNYLQWQCRKHRPDQLL